MFETENINACAADDSVADQVQLTRLLNLLTLSKEDPVEGLAGYLVTEDPTYLPDSAEIKVLARSIGRDKLLRLILTYALTHHTASEEA